MGKSVVTPVAHTLAESFMARTINRISATKLAALKSPGYYSDGGNLYFRVAPGGSRGFIFRFALHGRVRDMGMGPYPEVSLAKARSRAFEYRQLVADGIDPIAERDAKRAAARVEDAKAVTFDDCVTLYLKAHADGWRSVKHRQQWGATVAAYVSPVFGKLPVAAIDTGLVMRALEPIWSAKPETASRLRGRIERILDWAKVRGYRLGENPARWRGHLDHLLPAKSKVRRAAHYAALPYAEIGKFMGDLRQQDGVAARALEFLILTATRSGETRAAVWDEIDFDARMWVIPASRMKAGKEHRVPLSNAAVAILKAMQAIRHSDYIFPSTRGNRPLSEVALWTLLRRVNRGDITTHGFRSTFRDWAAERTNYENHVVEMALAHVVSNAVEAAYRRGDLFEKRRRLMDDWAAFCAKPSTPDTKVVPIRGARRK
jgi:integrase